MKNAKFNIFLDQVFDCGNVNNFLEILLENEIRFHESVDLLLLGGAAVEISHLTDDDSITHIKHKT